MVEEHPKPSIRPRRIIERPRLLRALDESDARIKLLVAGPGWGKTVLLEQWSAARHDRAIGRFRAHPSAADVAVVARGLVAAADTIVPGAGRRLLERLAVTDDPASEASVLAEMLAEDLGDWPRGGWIAIDDYAWVAMSPSSEAFVQTLVERSPAQMIIGARKHPAWLQAAEGHCPVFELSQSTLALSPAEVALVHPDLEPQSDAFRVTSTGWPVLVGLISMIDTVSILEVTASPDAQLRRVAKEVVRALDPTVHAGLVMLASLPLVDPEVAAAVLTIQRAEEVCGTAIELGILDERDQRLEIHAHVGAELARVGLMEQGTVSPRGVATALRIYRDRHDWDSAFELVRRHGLDDELAELMLDGVDEILTSGRLSTLDNWIRFARFRRVPSHPVFRIAEMEVQLRRGRYVSALTAARSMLDNSALPQDIRYRCHLIAARAANMGSCEDDALVYFRSARTLAQSISQEREARWGELMCTSALELPEAHTLLSELVESVVETDPTDQVRMAGRQLTLGFRFGSNSELSNSRRALELVEQVDDAFVRCSFLGAFGWGLVLSAYYEEALTVARRLRDQASELRFDSPIPYAHTTAAVALAGLGDYESARLETERADQAARLINAEHAVQNAYAIRVRVLLQEGATHEACATEPPVVDRTLPSMKGEVLASRALALATIGRVAEALEVASDAAACTRGIEAHGLCAAVEAVCALKQRSGGLAEKCDALIEHVFSAGCVDLAVTAYRANPDLLAVLLTSNRVRDQVVYLVSRAGDAARVEALGLSLTGKVDPVSTLSAREHEVYDLVCEGLSNADIARRLFISQSTVKVHVHHVFDKIGIRSRRALALNAAHVRYATSAATSVAGSVDGIGETIPKPSPRADL